MEGFRANDASFATKALHAGQEPEQWSSMAVVPPIAMSTTFKQYGPADFKEWVSKLWIYIDFSISMHNALVVS